MLQSLNSTGCYYELFSPAELSSVNKNIGGLRGFFQKLTPAALAPRPPALFTLFGIDWR